jgi:hypothetical protein
MSRNEHILIRRATSSDEQALAVLAVIDGGRDRLEGPVMVAEVHGRLRAAVGSNGAVVSDPFWPSAGLVDMLRVHSGLLAQRVARTPRFALRRPALA